MSLRTLRVISTVAASHLIAAGPAWADEPVAEVAEVAAPSNRFALAPHLASAIALRGLSPAREPAANSPFGAGVSIVELPVVGIGPGRQRTQHALSFRSETPRQMLRAIGIDATECATRLRVPSRLKQGRDGINFQIEAQIGFACKF